jgi:hypothetical protein
MSEITFINNFIKTAAKFAGTILSTAKGPLDTRMLVNNTSDLTTD